MAIARVLERDDLGGITFARDDGSTLYSYGPDAEALASELEQSAPAPPPQEYALDRSRLDDVLADAPRLAQAGGGFIEAAQAQRASDAQAARARAAQAPGGIAGELADLQAQGYGTGPEPAPAPPPADPFLDAINAPVYVPGSPGVSRAQLEQRAGQAVPIPRGYTEQVEGAVPLPPELMAEQGRIFDERAELARHEALGTMAGGEAQASRALADNQYWQRQAILRRAELHEARQKAEAKWAQIQQADQAIAAHQEDPQRFFKQKGTFATIAAAIAMGIGQYSASLGGGQNAAAAIISDAIDKDIAAQRQEYLTKKDARNNLVAQYDKILGDLDAATQAAAYTQKGIAISYGNQLAGLSKSAQAESAWARELLKLDQERLDVATKWIEQQTGKVIATTQNAIEFPRAGGGGYTRAPTDKERLGRAQTYTAIEGQRREFYGEPDRSKVATASAIEQAKADAKPVSDDISYRWAKDRSAVSGARDELDKFIARMEAQKKRFGRVPGLGIGSKLPGAEYVQRGVEALGSEEMQAARQNRQDMASMKIAAQSAIKGIPSDKDQRLIDESLKSLSVGTGEDVLRRAYQLRDAMDRGIEGLDAAIPATQRQRYQQQLEQLPAERPAPVEPD